MDRIYDFENFLMESEKITKSSIDQVWKKLRDTLMTTIPKPKLLTFTSEGVPCQSLNCGSIAGPGKKWGLGIVSWNDKIAISMDKPELKSVGPKLIDFFRSKGYKIDEKEFQASQSPGRPGYIDQLVTFDPTNPTKLKTDLEELIKKFPF